MAGGLVIVIVGAIVLFLIFVVLLKLLSDGESKIPRLRYAAKDFNDKVEDQLKRLEAEGKSKTEIKRHLKSIFGSKLKELLSQLARDGYNSRRQIGNLLKKENLRLKKHRKLIE